MASCAVGRDSVGSWVKEQEERASDSDESLTTTARPQQTSQELSAERDGPRFVGRRIGVWWDGDFRWFEGRVAKYKPLLPASGRGAETRHRFHIHYDDGDKKWHELAVGEVWKLLADTEV